MKIIDQLRPRLESVAQQAKALEESLSVPEVVDDISRYRKLSKDFANASELVAAWSSYQDHEERISQANEMLDDPELGSLAKEELENASIQLEQLATHIQRLLLPKDPDDDLHAILEIRAGTGGDESCLFAGDLFRMYTRYAERSGWKMELLSSSHAQIGGYKEIICLIEGEETYGKLKFESGGHRVQRVPETETQGRIHTSACTVAVLPEIPEEEIKINPQDLRIDTYRASGAGGQHVNKTDSAVRILHIPTGFVVECQDDRSQHRNRARALSVLAARLHDHQQAMQTEKTAQTRKLLIGSGDRSERIRTYNFPQGRITDHRINLTLYKLQLIMDGDIDELLNSLALHHQAQLLNEGLDSG